ncbi:MAG: tetratricopeptide repeat protein [Bacteroidota bacterium]
MKEITKIGCMAFALSFSFNLLFAQTADLAKIEQQFYTAYITNSVPAWTISLQQLAEKQDDSNQLLLAKGYYAAAGTALGNQNEDLAEELIDKAEELVKTLLSTDKKSPEGNALLSSVYGMQIGLSPMKGMYLGGKSSKAAEKGVELDPDNGFTNFVIGNNLFYTPAMWGGDTKKGIEHLEKAKGIYEAAEQTKSWEYMSVLATLGQAYHREEQYDAAKEVYATALEIAPNFGYVKMYLLPRTEKATKSK